MPTTATTTAAAKPVKVSSHIPALDGVRGIAILLVLFLHLTVFTNNEIAQGAAQKGLGSLARFGVMGVDLFFVLSGYLITGILYDAKGHKQYFRNFYARRTVRVFPLYYVMMALVLIAVPVLLPQLAAIAIKGTFDWSSWWYWLYLSNYLPFFGHNPGNHEILVVTWSLAIEEQFYMLWPLVCFFFSRRTLLWISGSLVLVAPIIRSIMVIAWGHQASDEHAWAMAWQAIGSPLFCRMDALAVGAFLVLMSRGPAGRDGLAGLARWVLPLGFLAVAGVVVGQKKILGWNAGFMQGKLYMSVGFTLVAIMCGAFLVLGVATAKSSLFGRVINSRLLAMFGRYSYGLYLLHMPVILSITHFLYGPAKPDSHPLITMPTAGIGGMLGQLVLYLVGVTILVGVALVSWHGMEKHFLKLKDLFPMDKDTSKKVPRSEAALTQTTKDEGPKIGVAP